MNILRGFFVLLLCSALVNAQIAIESGKSEGVIELEPGEGEKVSFVILNADEVSHNVVAEVRAGSELVHFREGKEYFLEAHERREVVLDLLIPEDYESGEEEVRVLFRSVPDEEGGGVQVLANVGKRIPLLVLGDGEESEGLVFDESASETASVEQSPSIELFDEYGFDDTFLFFLGAVVVLLGVAFYVTKTGKS